MAQDEKHFETADIGLAAALITSGISLERLNKQNPKRVKFHFIQSEELEQSIRFFWSKELKLPALALLENMRILKSRLYG